jgi:uncharacterized protein (DUF1015 family)
MDIIGVTIKVLNFDISSLLSKLFYQYVNMHIKSAETRRQIKEIAKLEAEQQKYLADQEIEHKKFSLAHEKAVKYNQFTLETSKKIRAFIIANGFHEDKSHSNDWIEELHGSLRGQTDKHFREMLYNIPHTYSYYVDSSRERDSYRDQSDETAYIFWFCKKCRSMTRSFQNDCDFCGKN